MAQHVRNRICEQHRLTVRVVANISNLPDTQTLHVICSMFVLDNWRDKKSNVHSVRSAKCEDAAA